MPVDELRADVARELTAAREAHPGANRPAPGHVEPFRKRVAPRRWHLPSGLTLLVLVALVVYLAASVWLREDLHYAIGDAIARSANAKQMLFSRDPHLAALGLVWPPFPTLVQVPFVLLLEPFGHADLAGPVSTSVVMAATVGLLGRICQAVGLGRALTLALVATFAFNPVVIFNAANGMSEASAFMFLAMTLLGLIRYVTREDPYDLILMGFGLAGVVLVRVEALGVLAVVTAAIVVMELRRGDRSKLMSSKAASSVALVSLPAIWAFLLWLLMQWLIKGDPLFFLSAQVEGLAPTHETNSYLPDVDANPLNAVYYAGRWMLLFSPALFVAAPLLLLGRWRRAVGGAALIACSLVIPGATAFLLIRKHSYGDPRYFNTVLVFGTAASAWLIGRMPRRRWLDAVPRSAIAGVLLVLGVAGAGLGTWGLSDPETTHVEGEAFVFARLVGEDPVVSARTSGQGEAVGQWRTVARDLERRVGPDEQVLIDANFSFPAPLYSSRPRSYIINSDRDYEAILASGDRLPTYVIALLGVSADIGKRVVEAQPRGWELAVKYGGISVFRRRPGVELNDNPLGGLM